MMAEEMERKACRARQKIARLLKLGIIEKPSQCEKCGIKNNVRPHHPDYDKPLEVIWLCQSCHVKLHRSIKPVIYRRKPGNRPKTERNLKIMEYWVKGYRQKSIANMFKMKESAVSMVIHRETRKLERI